MTPRAPRTLRAHDESGFTLIELMVTTLIIGILVAIALPTFLGARARASERSAQSLIRTAYAAAKVSYTDGGTYATLSPAALTAVDASVNYNTGPAVVGEVSVRDVSTSTMLLVSASMTGGVYCLSEDTAGMVYRGSDATDTFVTATDCNIGSW